MQIINKNDGDIVIEQNDSIGTFDWDIFEIEIYKLTTKDMIKPFFKNVF